MPMRGSGRIVPKKFLEDHFYGPAEIDINSNAVEVYIHRIRKQLGEAGAKVRVETLSGSATSLPRMNDDVERAGSPNNDRHDLVLRAFVLEWTSVAWMLIEGTVAIGAAVAARSITLLAFGADSLIELASAGVLLWRLRVELKQGRIFSEEAERITARIGGALLFVLALYVVATAALNLWRHSGADFSGPGLAIAAVSIPVMWWLARRKMAIAEPLRTAALRADAAESIACGYLAGVVVIGLLAQLLLEAWWVDGATSLGIVYFLVKEGREAWSAKSRRDED